MKFCSLNASHTTRSKCNAIKSTNQWVFTVLKILQFIGIAGIVIMDSVVGGVVNTETIKRHKTSILLKFYVWIEWYVLRCAANSMRICAPICVSRTFSALQSIFTSSFGSQVVFSLHFLSVVCLYAPLFRSVVQCSFVLDH